MPRNPDIKELSSDEPSSPTYMKGVKEMEETGVSLPVDVRKQELRKVFSELVISKGEGKDKESVNFTPEEIEAIIGNERVQTYFPETLHSILGGRFLKNVDNLEISLLDWKQATLKSPQLFGQKPETINMNVEESSQLLGLTKEQFVQAALKKPQLFSRSPETLNRNVEEISERFKLIKKQFVHAALRTPQLFGQKPETINMNVEESSQLLGLTKEQFIQAALKQPQLFIQKPETINMNVEESSQLLGLTKEQFIQAALKQPQIFIQKPETINMNVEESSQLLGLTKEQFTLAALKDSSLFYKRPETINRNAEEISQKLGLMKEQFTLAALKNPSLFSSNPETISNNFKILKKLFSIGNTNILKMPVLLTYAPERIMSFYIIQKIISKKISFLHSVTKNPLRLAENELSAEDYKKFELCYNYLSALSRKMRARKKEPEEKSKFYDDMVNFVERFFGKPNEPIDREQISAFEKHIKKHLKIKE